jgi:diazepam-binding inhibitor (GABA receptor modulating acyl-CoA-binding protein)
MSDEQNQMAFEQAVGLVKTLKTAPTDDEKLQLYAHYKQTKVGDCNTSQPSFWQLAEKAKWSAWTECKGMSKEKAAQAYVDLVKSLVAKYGTN